MAGDAERRYLAVRVQVGWGDCDPAGIVFYPRFYAWMDMVSHVLAREMGIPRDSMIPPGPEMLGFPVVGTEAQFLTPARMDDVLEVRTWVSRVGRSSLSLRHEIVRKDGDQEVVIARGREDRVFIGRDQHDGTMRSRELTEPMRAAMARYADANVDGLPSR
jgi:4-hydroxybenzoyl-CoA thioesterase